MLTLVENRGHTGNETQHDLLAVIMKRKSPGRTIHKTQESYKNL